MLTARCPTCSAPTRLGGGSIFRKMQCPACGSGVRVSRVRRVAKSVPVLLLASLWATLPSAWFPPAWVRILALAAVGIGTVFLVRDRLVPDNRLCNSP